MDVCVTVPKALWGSWIDEGTLPGEAWDGESEYRFFSAAARPDILPGERVYVVAHGLLRGYAPLVAIDVKLTGRASHAYSLFRWGLDADRQWSILEKFPLPLPEWWWPGATFGLVRHGGALACTIPERIRGFRGWRYRWWNRAIEVPFPDWQTKGVA